MILPSVPAGANAALVFADGSVFFGRGLGAVGQAVGEVCFNTGLSGYQETLTDPSYAAQIINFTFPHIGNVGTNADDIESALPAARGIIIRNAPTEPSSWRATDRLQPWLNFHGLVGIYGLDTRALTHRIRANSNNNAVIFHSADNTIPLASLLQAAQDWPGLNGLDLAKSVTCAAPYIFTEPLYGQTAPTARFKVVAIDYGLKRNIARHLVSAGCAVTVVPATTSAADILALKPDGVFLSNGPGDPAATGVYAVPVLQQLISANIPIFGICLGHQLLALAVGGKTAKLPTGHRGANHPVKNLLTGKVEITSQNHGFHVLPESLPTNAYVTHISLFDGSNEGFALKDKPVFSVQYHPEASPGPSDSHYLFSQFTKLMATKLSEAC